MSVQDISLLATLLSAVISSLTTSIVVYLVGKRVIKAQIDDLLEYFATQDGIGDLATIGAAIAAGAMTQLKTGHAAGGIKLGPIRIPQTLVDAALAKILGPMLGMAQGQS